MKININKILILAGTALITFNSCTKFIKDGQNDDPTVLMGADPTVLLPTAELNTGYYYGGDLARMTSLFTQQTVGGANQYASAQNYLLTTSDFSNAWNAFYITSLNSLNKIKELSIAKGYKHYQGISMVLSDFNYVALVDHWNNVPFTEALLGAKNLTPKYDDAATIYTAVLKDLDDAIVLLNTASDKAGLLPGADDLMYGGDVSMWIKFAHALKAKMYLNLSKKDASKAAMALAELADGFTSSADEAKIAYSAVSPGPASQFQDQRNGDMLYIGSYAYNMMATDGDGRMDAWIDSSNDAMGTFYYDGAAPVFLLSYTEQKFMQAELEARAGAATAAATFADAITESFMMAGASGEAAIIAAYPYNAAETNVTKRIEPIMMQKYIAMFNNPTAFSDWRRTGIPALTPTTGASIPRRFLYSVNETSSNPNVPTANVGLFDRVFWD
jgi:Starch-binding associating with outer membrane